MVERMEYSCVQMESLNDLRTMECWMLRMKMVNMMIMVVVGLLDKLSE
jgi:hypothetical protein